MPSSRLGLLALAVMLPCACAQSDNLTIKLTGNNQITRIHARYTCDANAAKFKLPSGPFTVEYIRVGNNGLAVLPIAGERIIFAQVVSASGGRYASGWNEWSDKGDDAWLTTPKLDPNGKETTTNCHAAK